MLSDDKIESFGINLTSFNQHDKKVSDDWNLIIDKNWKHRKTKTAGIICLAKEGDYVEKINQFWNFT